MAPVDMFAFKKPRHQSTLAHTGVFYLITLPNGKKEEWIHEVTGGQDNGLLTNKSQIVRRKKQPDELFEEVFRFASFDDDDIDDFDDLFEYPWDYHLLFNNCRDQVIFFMNRLDKKGVAIVHGAVEWVNNIKHSDVVLGVTIAAALVGASVGIYKYLTSPKEPEKKEEPVEVVDCSYSDDEEDQCVHQIEHITIQPAKSTSLSKHSYKTAK